MINKSDSILILSPHCDDIPLSLGGALLNGSLGSEVLVLVVFSRSKYTKDSRGNSPVQATTKLRKKEERTAAKVAKYNVKFLNFGEPFVRYGFNKIEDVLDSNRDISEDILWPKVKKKLNEVIDKHSGLVLGPLSIGNHIDHRIVHKVLQDYNTQSKNANIGFFEDLPYGYPRNYYEIKWILNHDFNYYREVPLKVADIDQKINLLKSYNSQMTIDYLSSIRQHFNRYNTEYIWIPK